MKSCYDTCFIDIRVTMETWWRYVIYLPLYFSVPGVFFFYNRLRVLAPRLVALIITKFEQSLWERFRNILNKVLKVRKTLNEHAIDIISYYLKKMMRSETDAASSYSGLISSESSHEKRGRLLRSIARKKNLIRLRSAAFFTVFECNFVHAYKSILAVRKYI